MSIRYLWMLASLLNINPYNREHNQVLPESREWEQINSTVSQGFEGIRQWVINLCTPQIYQKPKISLIVWTLIPKFISIKQDFKPKVHKVFKPTNKR